MPIELQKPHSHILAEHITPIWLLKFHIFIFAEHILSIWLQNPHIPDSAEHILPTWLQNLISPISQKIFCELSCQNFIFPNLQNLLRGMSYWKSQNRTLAEYIMRNELSEVTESQFRRAYSADLVATTLFPRFRRTYSATRVAIASYHNTGITKTQNMQPSRNTLSPALLCVHALP